MHRSAPASDRLVAIAFAVALALLLAPGSFAAPASAPGSAPVSAPGSAPDPTTAGMPPDETSADDALEARVREVLGLLPGNDSVEVRARGGVVLLSGTVLDPEHRQRLVEVVERMDGVLAVEDDLQTERNLKRRLAPVADNLRAEAIDLLTAIPLFLIAVAIVALFWWIGRFVAARESLTRRWAPNAFIADFLRVLLRGAIVVAGAILALEVVGATAFLGSILGALGLAGLAVGIVVRDTVENFIASLLLSVRQPFAPQDHVVIEGHEGRVARLTSRATILMSLDGNHIRIPNAIVYKGTIVNYTRNPNRRFDFEVGIDSGADASAAAALATRTVAAIPAILADPAPVCLIDRLGDSNVVLRVLAWVDQTRADFGKARSATIDAVKKAFEGAGVGMPEPIFLVRRAGAAAVPAEPEAEPEAGRAAGAARAGAAPSGPAAAVTEESLRPDTDLQRQAERYAAGEDLLDPRAAQE